MTNKKKPPESSEANSTDKIKYLKAKQDVCGDGDIFSGSGSVHIAKNDPMVTRSKLPEPTETPPPPRVAKPKK